MATVAAIVPRIEPHGPHILARIRLPERTAQALCGVGDSVADLAGARSLVAALEIVGTAGSVQGNAGDYEHHRYVMHLLRSQPAKTRCPRIGPV